MYVCVTEILLKGWTDFNKKMFVFEWVSGLFRLTTGPDRWRCTWVVGFFYIYTYRRLFICMYFWTGQRLSGPLVILRYFKWIKQNICMYTYVYI